MSVSVSRVKMGKRELEVGGPYLGLLRESNDILNDTAALKERLEQDGYLLIRGLQRPELVRAARAKVVDSLAANGQIDGAYPLDEAVIARGGRGAFLGGQKAVTRTPEFLQLVESPEIMGFFARLFAERALTFDYKWLRAVGTGDSTGAHYDVVYMGRGTRAKLHTCWTPLGDISLEQGPLAVLASSHNGKRYERLRQTYGRMDVDRDNIQGWFSDDPIELVDKFGGQWKTAHFGLGDVMIFGMYLMHGSLANQTQRYRISCDTRYQPAGEAVDERWVGENPKAHYAWMKTPAKAMADARREWGV